MKRVVIIGSNSFIAKSISKSEKFFKQKLFHYGIENDSVAKEFILFKYPEHQINLRELLKIKPDLIIYCAGAGIQSNVSESTELIYHLNAFLPINLINFLEQEGYKGKFITFGSYFEIGDNNENLYFTEDNIQRSMLEVKNDYSISKRLLTRYLGSKNPNINFYHLFLPNLYGFGENPARLIPYTINKILNNEIMSFTEGTQIRQYLHIEDLVHFIEFIGLNQKIDSGFYNVVNEECYTVKEVVKLITQILHKPFHEEFFGKIKGRDSSMRVLKLDNSKMLSTEFKPKINLYDGIKTYL